MIYILTACLVLVFLLFFTSYLLYRGVFYYPQKKHVDPYQIPDDMLYAPYKNAMLHLLHEMEQTPYEEVSIRSQDGLSLCGRLYLFRPDAPLMLFFHGYHGTFLWDGLGSFRFCRKNHINLLVVDERSHGKSADQIITFGIRECKDVKCWADYAAKRFPEKSLILSGVSMGSASVMMASVLSLPSDYFYSLYGNKLPKLSKKPYGLFICRFPSVMPCCTLAHAFSVTSISVNQPHYLP